MIGDTKQQESPSTDKSFLLSSYIKMNIPNDDDRLLIDYNKNKLERLMKEYSAQLLTNGEPSISVGKGSLTLELIMSGNISYWLSPSNLEIIGIYIKNNAIVDGILDYATIRGVLAIAIGDIKIVHYVFTKLATTIFKVNPDDIIRTDIKIGATENLLIFLKAVDIMKNDSLSVEHRLNSAEIALHNIKEIYNMASSDHAFSLSNDDFSLIKKYQALEIKRISLVDTKGLSEEDEYNANKYNKITSEIKEIFTMKKQKGREFI